MPNNFFQFKEFIIHQDKCAMKVTTDACLFGAWVAEKVSSRGSGVQTVLDIGAGTGLLSLMLAQKCKAEIDAVETDEDTAGQALENVAAFPGKSMIKVIHADARTFSFPKSYDLVISNPPFYENELKSFYSKKNIAHHSDNLSLEELLTVIKSNLNPDGTFYLLLPYKRDEEIRKLVRETEMQITQVVLVRQSVNHDYFRIMLEGNLFTDETTEIQFDEIAIWNERQQYTEEFAELLRDYYLHL
jgi:tRNA1Val (adenine37-N6)-methyltransferase